MSKKTLRLAILFADIAQSTHIYDALGDKSAQILINSCLSLLAKITRKHKGTVIKTIGDELMCAFAKPALAVRAAKDMQQSLSMASIVDAPGYEPPNIYVGIHYGPVIIQQRDVFGDTVNVAARIMELTKQRQIVISQQVYDALSDEMKSTIKCIDKTTIKGKSGEFNLFEAIWEAQDVTIVFESPLESLYTKVQKNCLELTYRDQVIRINQENPSATIGRQTHNDIVVNTKYASRSHARVEFRRGKFILADQSSNGTYLVCNGKENIRLKREESQLIGSGNIYLGQSPAPKLPYAIHFKLVE